MRTAATGGSLGWAESQRRFAEREKHGRFSRSPQGMGSRRSEKWIAIRPTHGLPSAECALANPVMHWNRGLIEVLTLYTLNAAGVLVGLVRGRAPLSRILRFPLTAIPIFIVAFTVAAILGDLLQKRWLAERPVAAILVSAFFFLFGGLAGRALVRSLQSFHQRGTLLELSSRSLPAISNEKPSPSRAWPSTPTMKPNTSK
jgi:hypothetical protein